MAQDIHLHTGELSASLLKKATAELETAQTKLKRLDNYGELANAVYTNPQGFTSRLFPSEFSSTAADLAWKLKELEEKLDCYAAILDSGPDALEQIDSSYKNQLTNWWSRTTYSVGAFISDPSAGVVGFFTNLFSSKTETGGETIIREDYNGPYADIVDDFDWSKSTATNEQIEAAVQAGMMKAMDSKADANVVIREELKKLYDSTPIFTEYDVYRKKTEAITEIVPIGQPQDTKDHGAWMCTWASVATMLCRKQAAEGKTPTFTRDGIYELNPSMYWENLYTASDGSTYAVKTRVGSVSEDYLVELLKGNSEQNPPIGAHPEGIVVYSNYTYWDDKANQYKTGQHAIVITDFVESEDGSFQFYADDPVNNRDGNAGRIPLEDTWLYKVQPNILENAQRICYVE